MKLTYAITACNELDELKILIPFLKKHKRPQDEIVILFDQKNGKEEVIYYLITFNKYPNIQSWRGYFNNDFSDWKNQLKDYCSGDYIFQIDADELPTEFMVNTLPLLIEDNPETEVYLVPRVNTVVGLTDEHIKKWGWRVDENNRINWPDYQWRVWKNIPEIKWINKVHERLDGFKTFAPLPLDSGFEECYLEHPKTISRQEKQNDFYTKLSN